MALLSFLQGLWGGKPGGKPAPARPPASAAAVAVPEPTGVAATSGAHLSPAAVLRALQELALGELLQDAPAPAQSPVMAAVAATLESIESDPRHMPRRPLLLPQLLRAVNDSETSLRAVARIIAQDPALAGNLLRMANSPFYRVTSKPVESVERAVAVLGTQGIRALIAAALVQPVLTVPGGAFRGFPEVVWEHTLRSAAAAESHAALVESADPFAAHLLGLVLGLGTLVVFRVALDEYAKRPGLLPEGTTLAALLDAHAGPTAQRIAGSWELSERVLAALWEQALSAELAARSPLGRSLAFGQLVGALDVLRERGRISEPEARAVVLASDRSQALAERIWERLLKQRSSTGAAQSAAESRRE